MLVLFNCSKSQRKLGNFSVSLLQILLHGPIECRRGVFLLEEKHVTILGGEVDALVIINAYENVLARKL